MIPADGPPEPGGRELLVALLVFIVLTVAMNAPMAWSLGERYAVPDGDFAFGYWNVWWTAEALGNFENPFYTDEIFYPEGVSLLWRDFPFLATAAAAPLTGLFGPMVAYNLIYLATFVLAGLAAYLLASYVTRSFLAALGAGLAYAFLPAHFLSYGQQSSSHVQWLPLVVLCLLRLRDTGRWGYGAWAGVWLAASLHSGLYFGIYAAFTVVAIGLWCLVVRSDCPAGRGAWLRGLAACVGVSALLFAPRGVPMAIEAMGSLEIDYAATGSRADLLGLSMRTEPHEPARLVSWPAFFGWVFVAGAVAGAVLSGWRRSRMWIVLAAGFFLFALGPDLYVAGHRVGGVPMLGDLVARLPLLSSLRAHHRALIVVILCMTVLFARLLQRLDNGPVEEEVAPPSTRRQAAVAAILALMLIEFWPPPANPRANEAPEAYSVLEAAASGAVLPVPVDVAVAPNALERPMFFQTFHGLPLVGGYTSRLDPSHRERLATSEFLASLLADDPQDPTRIFAVPEAEAAALYRGELAARSIAAVVLNPMYVIPVDGGGPPERPGNAGVEPATFLTPLWHGPMSEGLMRPVLPAPFETRVPRRPWMDASVIPYLEAVLGKPDYRPADGSWIWILDERD